jgi:hypothetical protein
MALRPSEVFRDAAFVVGGAAVLWGVHFVSMPSAWIAGGAAVMFLAYATAESTPEEQDCRTISDNSLPRKNSATTKRATVDEDGWVERPPVTAREDRVRFRHQQPSGDIRPQSAHGLRLAHPVEDAWTGFAPTGQGEPQGTQPAASFASRQLSEYVEDKLADQGVYLNLPGSAPGRFRAFANVQSWTKKLSSSFRSTVV